MLRSIPTAKKWLYPGNDEITATSIGVESFESPHVEQIWKHHEMLRDLGNMNQKNICQLIKMKRIKISPWKMKVFHDEILPEMNRSRK